MPTHQYILNGEKVPGVTTALNELSKPALVHWAFRCGKEHPQCNTPYEISDPLARIGTLAHDMIISTLIKKQYDVNGYAPYEINRAENCALSFWEWAEPQSLIPIVCEEPLISAEHGFGGTPDFYGTVAGKYTVFDIKTGKDIYSDYWYQLAAYGELHKERGNTIDRFMIINVGRAENENFKVESRTNLDMEWLVFYHALKIYKIKKQIKGRKDNE